MRRRLIQKTRLDILHLESFVTILLGSLIAHTSPPGDVFFLYSCSRQFSRIREVWYGKILKLNSNPNPKPVVWPSLSQEGECFWKNFHY